MMKLPETPSQPRASIIIRTFNEGRHLPGVLSAIAGQRCRSLEVLIVDSGSTDNTVQIAEMAGARIVHIQKEEFPFGRSLNVGCRAALGEFLVLLSGHCYPKHEDWLEALLMPFDDELIGLVYGRQRGDDVTKYSEHRHFEKTFPDVSVIPQAGFFCNNANSAIRRALWLERPFDETLTGLEDLDWANWLTSHGRKVAYCAEASVSHVHEEKWSQVFRRYEREAIALKRILPDVSFSLFDFVRLLAESAYLDTRHAMRYGELRRRWNEIMIFRLMQYWGTYRGSRNHKTVSQEMKEKFFYPK